MGSVVAHLIQLYKQHCDASLYVLGNITSEYKSKTAVSSAGQYTTRTQGIELIRCRSEEGRKTYVHCKAGRSRSATMCAAYVMQKLVTLQFSGL